MKTVFVEKTFPVGVKKGWEMLTNLPNYPQFVPFITDVTLREPLKEGVVWHDTTNILWVTQRVSHQVKVIREYERLVFTVPVVGGEITEEFTLEEVGRHTKIAMRVSVSFRPWLVEETVGRVLARRFEHMLTKTLINLEEYFVKK